MGQTRGSVQTIARAAPDIAALGFSVPALASVAVVVPTGGEASRTTGGTYLAMATCATGWAYARVAGYAVDAGGSVGAGIAGALVDIDATVGPGKTWRALAAEPVDTIYAAAPVETR